MYHSLLPIKTLISGLHFFYYFGWVKQYFATDYVYSFRNLRWFIKHAVRSEFQNPRPHRFRVVTRKNLWRSWRRMPMVSSKSSGSYFAGSRWTFRTTLTSLRQGRGQTNRCRRSCELGRQYARGSVNSSATCARKKKMFFVVVRGSSFLSIQYVRPCHGRGGEREVLTQIWLVCPHFGCLVVNNYPLTTPHMTLRSPETTGQQNTNTQLTVPASEHTASSPNLLPWPCR